MALACELQKPLFVHEREAHSELVSILESFGKRLPPTVIHCFTGSAEHAAKYLQMGFYIGLTGTWPDGQTLSPRSDRRWRCLTNT